VRIFKSGTENCAVKPKNAETQIKENDGVELKKV
jgi:hypothetical protein